MPDVYISPTGSDANNGLTAGAPVLTASRAMAILENAPGTPQTVYLMGGTFTSRLVFGNTKNGTEGAPITVKNYPSERAVIAPTVGTTNYTWEHAVKFTGNHWGLEAEAPSDRRDWNQMLIAVDGGSTGILNRTGVEYNPSGYVYVAGDFIRGMSGVQFEGNATTANVYTGTVSTGARIVNVGVRNCKKWGLQIARYKGPTLIQGCLLYKAQMENIRQWYFNYGAAGSTSYAWGYGAGCVSGSSIYNDGGGAYVPGPHSMIGNVIDHCWGESLGSYATTDVLIQDNLIIEPHRLGIYLDAVQRFQVINNDVLFPSNPDIADDGNLWNMFGWSSEKADKVARDGLVYLNRFVGGPSGMFYGWKEVVSGTNPSNVTHAHNVCVGQSTRTFQAFTDPIDNATVILQNNVFDGPVPAGTTTGTWRRNAFANAPAALCLGSGGFVNASLGLLKAVPLTKAGYTKEYCRPSGSSPLLQAGLAITSVPIGSVTTDTDGDTWEANPTLGAFRSAAVSPTVSTQGIALFFGGATTAAAISVNEVEVAETAGGSDISGTATVRGTAGITNIANIVDNNTGNTATMSGDSSVLMLWSAAKTIAEIRVNCSADETAPNYLVAYSVTYEKGRPTLARIGDWSASGRDGSGWMTFTVTVDQDSIIMRARSSVGDLF